MSYAAVLIAISTLWIGCRSGYRLQYDCKCRCSCLGPRSQTVVTCTTPPGVSKVAPVLFLQHGGRMSTASAHRSATGIVKLGFTRWMIQTFCCGPYVESVPLDRFRMKLQVCVLYVGLATDVSGPVTCRACAAGGYASDSGTSSCPECPHGTYSTFEATFCQQKQVGFFSTVAATSCSSCPAGRASLRMLGARMP